MICLLPGFVVRLPAGLMFTERTYAEAMAPKDKRD